MRSVQEKSDKEIRAGLKLSYDLPEGFRIEVAKTADDIESALSVLHDSYVQAGYMDPHPSGLRFLPQHALATTTVAIARLNDEIIGTVSLIQDNLLGLPMDSIFDLSQRRANGSVLAEISSLALMPEHRIQNGLLTYPIQKFSISYLQSCTATEEAVIAVNPSMAALYRAVFMAKQLASNPVNEYAFVKGAPAVGLSMELEKFSENLIEAYGDAPADQNFAEYILNGGMDHIVLPRKDAHRSFEPVSPKTFERLLKRSQILLSLNSDKKLKLLRAWEGSHHAEILKSMCPKSLGEALGRRSFRFQAQGRAEILSSRSEIGAMETLNVSREGLLVKSPNAPIEGLNKMKIAVGDGKWADVVARASWSRMGRQGFEIMEASPEWHSYIADLEMYLND